jgi:hypothetical protein
MGIKRLLHPFVLELSELTGEHIPSKKEEEEYHWRRIRRMRTQEPGEKS